MNIGTKEKSNTQNYINSDPIALGVTPKFGVTVDFELKLKLKIINHLAEDFIK